MFIVPEVADVDFRPLSGHAIILTEYTLPEGIVIARDHPDPYDD